MNCGVTRWMRSREAVSWANGWRGLPCPPGVIDYGSDEVDHPEMPALLLAEELALLAIDPDRGRASIGERSLMNATLAGLLIAELLIDGVVAPDTDLVRTKLVDPGDPLLSAALRVVETAGRR